MSYRELWVFIQGLPQDSLTQTALRDSPEVGLRAAERPADEPAKFGPWSLLNYQIAALTDAVKRLCWVAEVTSPRLKDPEPPEPTPRPGLERPEQPRQSEAAVLYLDRIRARG